MAIRIFEWFGFPFLNGSDFGKLRLLKPRGSFERERNEARIIQRVQERCVLCSEEFEL